jgi:tRNA-dihydrouridine synthase A
VQLGGSDVKKLVEAIKIACDFGYDAINLNIGCPSDRVQSGAFGACLMKNPPLVADIIHAMQSVTQKPVTVKCRIGVDDDEPQIVLPHFIETISGAGCKHFIIHARKAWLSGLSPKENREIPPLDYNLVYDIKKSYPHLHIGINGGIDNVNSWHNHLNYVDEIMVGRTAYHIPDILTKVDSVIYNTPEQPIDYAMIIQKMADYCDNQMRHGVKFYSIIRHLLGLFHGLPNARRWRRILSENGTKDTANSQLLLDAYHIFMQ